MKKLLLITSGFVCAAYAAVAGGLLDAQVESEVIEAAPSSTMNWIIPLVLLGIVAAIAASDSGGS